MSDEETTDDGLDDLGQDALLAETASQDDAASDADLATAPAGEEAAPETPSDPDGGDDVEDLLNKLEALSPDAAAAAIERLTADETPAKVEPVPGTEEISEEHRLVVEKAEFQNAVSVADKAVADVADAHRIVYAAHQQAWNRWNAAVEKAGGEDALDPDYANLLRDSINRTYQENERVANDFKIAQHNAGFVKQVEREIAAYPPFAKHSKTFSILRFQGHIQPHMPIREQESILNAELQKQGIAVSATAKKSTLSPEQKQKIMAKAKKLKVGGVTSTVGRTNRDANAGSNQYPSMWKTSLARM